MALRKLEGVTNDEGDVSIVYCNKCNSDKTALVKSVPLANGRGSFEHYECVNCQNKWYELYYPGYGK